MPDDLAQQLDLAKRQLEATQRVSGALFSVTDIDALQQLALQAAMDAVQADAGSLLVYDAQADALVFRQATGPVAESLIGTRIDLALGLGIAGAVFLSGEARLSANVDDDDAHVGTVDARTGYQTRSLMTVPLRRPNALPLGVLQLVNKRVGVFDESDAATVEVVGSLIVTAMQNARLAQEARLAAVARSVGEISHDIGNMLTQVLPYVQTLGGFIEDVRAGVPGAQESLETFYGEVLESVTDGVQQVQARTREIARAVKGEVSPVEFEPGRPFRAAMRVISSLAGFAVQRGVALRAGGDQNFTARYDRSRIYNALYNLVSNGLAETEAGGTVTITAQPEGEPGFYTLSVADTGGGMSEDMRKRLFTDAVRSTKPGGTGLGTRIVRRIVEQHGGAVGVESTLGQGTTITLRLPLDPEKHPHGGVRERG